MLFRLDEDFFVNEIKVNSNKILRCKSKDVINFAQCSVCQVKKAGLAIELNTSKDLRKMYYTERHTHGLTNRHTHIQTDRQTYIQT